MFGEMLKLNDEQESGFGLLMNTRPRPRRVMSRHMREFRGFGFGPFPAAPGGTYDANATLDYNANLQVDPSDPSTPSAGDGGGDNWLGQLIGGVVQLGTRIIGAVTKGQQNQYQPGVCAPGLVFNPNTQQCQSPYGPQAGGGGIDTNMILIGGGLLAAVLLLRK